MVQIYLGLDLGFWDFGVFGFLWGFFFLVAFSLVVVVAVILGIILQGKTVEHFRFCSWSNLSYSVKDRNHFIRTHNLINVRC